MTSFAIDDIFHSDSDVLDVLEDRNGLAAIGVFTLLGSNCGREMYTHADSFDGGFDLNRVRRVAGNVTPAKARSLAALLETHRLIESMGDGRWRICCRAGLAQYGGMQHPKQPKTAEEIADLHAKRSAAGKRGGVASGEARRSKTGTVTAKRDEANSVKQNEANAKQIASPFVEANEESSHTIPSHTIPLTPTPSAAEAEANAVAMADAIADTEHAIDRNPFGLCWQTYRPMAGTKSGAEAAFSAVIEAGVTPRRLYAAILSHNRSVEQGDEPMRSQPSFQHWLERGAYKPLLPPDTTPKQRIHTHSWNCEHVQTIMQPHESEYDRQRQGFEPSAWMTACQTKADQLNHEEQQA